MAWQIEYHDGVYLPQLDWWLDARRPQRRSFVSHAHFDHLASHAEILLSPGTAALMQARLPDRSGDRVEHTFPFDQPGPLPGARALDATTTAAATTVTLLPAGHIHGSAMILLEHAAHGRLLYTGDFKLRPGRSAETCRPAPADVLIMETTYGRPRYVLPPTETVLADVVAFCRAALDDGDTPVLFGYSLGKSQEILHSLAGADLPVMLHPQPLRLTRIYETLGVTFPPYSAFDTARHAGHVVLCPPLGPEAPFLRRIPRRRTASLTGWALDPGARFRLACDATFPLSDHADYDDLHRLVSLVRPSRVLTLHGFASDFARDLRARGTEAWSLLGDNQLEMSLDAPLESQPKNAAAPVPRPTPSPDTLDALAATMAQISATPAKTEKIRHLAEHLARLDGENAALVAQYAAGRVFAPSESRTLNVGWALLRRAVLGASGRTEGDFRAAHRRLGDSAEAAGVMLSEAAANLSHAPLALTDLARLFEELATLRAPSTKLALLEATLRRLDTATAKLFIKTITGDLRAGLREGLVEEALALASGQPLDAIRAAGQTGGDLAAVARAAFAGRLSDLTVQVFQPVQCMLASPEPSAAALIDRLPPPVWIEEKYDGIRCQLHRRGDRVELYSRDLHRVTDQFPEIVRAAQTGLHADCVLDGELMAWRDDRALPFADLQKRLNRRLDGDDLFLGTEIPLSYSAFDLLWLDGIPLLHRSLRERRARLATVFATPPQGLRLAPVFQAHDAAAIEAAFQAARRRGNEGLMAKDPESAYTPGRRGLAWLKLKRAQATLDVVVVAVEPGRGKRRGLLSDFTFAVRDEDSDQLRVLGKAYSGLTDAELAELTEHFRQTTLEERGRVLHVSPDTVIEIAFDRIQLGERHDSGFTLRFPRIVRLRRDKSPREIDTLATCRRLAEAAQAFSEETL